MRAIRRTRHRAARFTIVLILLPTMANEALMRKSQADLILERAAMQLQQLLKEACAELRPFPSFPNAIFTNAIE